MTEAVKQLDYKYQFRLYVAGQKSKSLTAVRNLQLICEQYLKDRYHIEIIDLVEDPELAELDQIVAIPTLVRSIPEPVKRIIGDLSKLNKVQILIGIDSPED